MATKLNMYCPIDMPLRNINDTLEDWDHHTQHRKLNACFDFPKDIDQIRYPVLGSV
jgi:hypothetical protein